MSDWLTELEKNIEMVEKNNLRLNELREIILTDVDHLVKHVKALEKVLAAAEKIDCDYWPLDDCGQCGFSALHEAVDEARTLQARRPVQL